MRLFTRVWIIIRGKAMTRLTHSENARIGISEKKPLFNVANLSTSLTGSK